MHVENSISPFVARTAGLIAALFIAASCAGSDGTSPRSTSPTSTPTSASSQPSSNDGTVTQTPVPTDPSNTAVQSSEVESSEVEGSEVSNTSDESAGDLQERATEVCDVLDEAGYETRTRALTALLDDAGDDRSAAQQAVSDECEDALTRLLAAQDIEARSRSLAADPDPVSITRVRCSDGTYSFVVENTSDHDLGVHIAFRIFESDAEQARSSADYPIVIWQLAPGAQQGITGDFQEPPTDDYRCNLSARVFIADLGAGDASVEDGATADRTGDDPVEWFGPLLEDETLAIGSNDIDAAASTEDLRSLFYDDVLEANTDGEPTSRVPTAVRICSATIDQPGPDRMSFVYSIAYDDGESFSRHGLFRRGSDGMWRWLSAAQYFESDVFADCALDT